MAVVSEESELVEADAEGSADIEDRELSSRRPLTLDCFMVCVDVVDREEDEDEDGVGEAVRVEDEVKDKVLATCRGCGVFRASSA